MKKTLIISIVLIPILVMVGIYMSALYRARSIPQRALTAAEAEPLCEALLRQVAGHNSLDSGKFRKIYVRRYKMAPNMTPTWEFFYQTPEDTRNVYEFYWSEEYRSVDWSTLSKDDFRTFILKRP